MAGLPASLRFAGSHRGDGRDPEVWGYDAAGQAHRRVAAAWLSERLRGTDDGSDWRTVRERLGELEALTVTASKDEGPVAAAAGSYEPEVHGHGPSRYAVAIEVTGSAAVADFTVAVDALGSATQRPEVAVREVRWVEPMAVASTADERALERLSAAICAAPEDDAPRVALADFWCGLGEPRGEFVRAQLAGDEARARELLARHGKLWTDGLPVAREGRVYRRGFLSEARVDCAAVELRKVIDSPAWNLLTGLHLEVGSAERHFLKKARLGSLRRLAGISAETVEAIELPPTVTHLQTRGRLFHCPARLEALEIAVFRFDELWVFATQQKHPQLALLSVQAHHGLEYDDLLTVQGLLAEPRPARVVIALGKAWRLEVVGDTWDFVGDARVLRSIRDVQTSPFLIDD